MNITRDVYLTKQTRIEPISVVYASRVPIELTVKDYTITGATAKAYAEFVETGAKYQNQGTVTISSDKITFTPDAGLFTPGRNKLQVVLTLSSNAIVTFLIDVFCEENLSAGIVPSNPVSVLSAAERAESAATRAEAVQASIPSSYTQLSNDVDGLKEELAYQLERTENIFNYKDAKDNMKFLPTNGTFASDNGYFITDYMVVNSGTKVKTNNIYADRIAFYDSNKVFQSCTNMVLASYNIPNDAYYAVMQISHSRMPFANIGTLMVTIGDSTDFQPYYVVKIRNNAITSDKIANNSVTYEKLSSDLQNDIGVKIPDYAKQPLYQKTLSFIKKKSDFSFMFETDIHVTDSRDNTYKFVFFRNLYELGILDCIVNGGDMQGYQSKDSALSHYIEFNKIQKSIPYFVCKGNHDTFGGSYSNTNLSNVITMSEWFNSNCRNIGVQVHFDESNPLGGYYYYDFIQPKIRMIVLNTSQTDGGQTDGIGSYFNPIDVIIRQSQFDWLNTKALNFIDKTDRTDWSVVIVSHASINGGAELGGLGGYQVMDGMINAFINGSTYAGSQHSGSSPHHVELSCDFTEQGRMEFICAISGHMHYDSVTMLPTSQRPCISIGSATIDNSAIESGAPTGANRPSRTDGTITSELFDIIGIDKTNRKIRLTRFGAGSDREVSY